MNRRSFIQRMVGVVVSASIAAESVKPKAPEPIELHEEGIQLLEGTQPPDADYKQWTAILVRDGEIKKQTKFKICGPPGEEFLQDPAKYHQLEMCSVREWLESSFDPEDIQELRDCGRGRVINNTR